MRGTHLEGNARVGIKQGGWQHAQSHQCWQGLTLLLLALQGVISWLLLLLRPPRRSEGWRPNTSYTQLQLASPATRVSRTDPPAAVDRVPVDACQRLQ